ncbi:MAG: O-antigen ligase family protein [Pseudomonadota bacterium]|nr:O-antigen ligase family protein [Pseudomonadota bacterium]
MTQVPRALKKKPGGAALAAGLPWLVGAVLLALYMPATTVIGGMMPLFLLGLAAMAVAVSVHPLFSFAGYYGALFFADTALSLGISANQVLAGLFLASFTVFWVRGRALRLETGWLPLLAAAAAYYALSGVAGEAPEHGVVHSRYTLIYFSLAVCLAKSLAEERSILTLAWIVTAATFVAACHGFVQAAEMNILSGFSGRWTNAVRVSGTAKNSILFGWNMVFAVPFAFLLYSELRSPRLRMLALGCALAAMAAAALTFNRQTYVVIALVLGLSAWLFTYRNRRALLSAVALLGGLGALTIFPMILRRLMTLTNVSRDPSFLERRDSFLVGMQMFREHPFFGVGFGSFSSVWKQYVPADFSTYYVQYMHATRPRFPDFGYLALLAETGAVGLAVFALLLSSAAWRAWRLRRSSLESGDLFAANYSALVLVLTAYVAATSAIQDTLLYPRVWMVFALALLCSPRIWAREQAA